MKRVNLFLFEDASEGRVGRIAFGKVVAVFSAQRTHERVALLPTDLAILVPVAIVKTWLLHGCLLVICAGRYGSQSHHVGGNDQADDQPRKHERDRDKPN